MTRQEEISSKAKELGQKYFPDEANVWARGNIEAEYVESACVEMAKWADSTMIDKACEWLESLSGYVVCGQKANVSNFRKAMEGGAQ